MLQAPARSCGAGALPRLGEALTSHSSYLILSVSFQSIFMDWREREDLVLPAFPYGGGAGAAWGARLAEALQRSRPRSEISL